MTQIEKAKDRIEKEREYYQSLNIDGERYNGIIAGLEFALNVIDTLNSNYGENATIKEDAHHRPYSVNMYIGSASECLEKEAKRYFDESGVPYFWCNDDEQMDCLMCVARHFAQWGASHVKKSDISQHVSETCKENGDSLTDDLEKVVDELSKIYSGGENGGSPDPKRDEFGFRIGFKNGIKWLKWQMMKNAILCKVFWYDGPLLDYTREQVDEVLEKLGIVVGDSVKLIILKDNEKEI